MDIQQDESTGHDIPSVPIKSKKKKLRETKIRIPVVSDIHKPLVETSGGDSGSEVAESANFAQKYVSGGTSRERS